MDDRAQMKEQLMLMYELQRRRAGMYLRDFLPYINPKYQSTFTAPSFRIWNNSAGIPSPPLALFVVMLSKAHLTSHSRPQPHVRLPRAWPSTPRDLWASLCVFCLSKQLHPPLSAYQLSHKSLTPLDPNSRTHSFLPEGLRTISL